MGKLEENKKKKKQLLLDSSFDLFMKKGWLETTISDIVKQAHVAKGTFYLYFKDKYDIRNNLIAYKANQLLLSAHDELRTNHPDITNIKDEIVFIMQYAVSILREDHALLKLIAKICVLPLILVLAVLLGIVKLFVGIYNVARSLFTFLLGAMIVLTIIYYQDWLQVGFLAVLSGIGFAILFVGIAFEVMIEEFIERLGMFVMS